MWIDVSCSLSLDEEEGKFLTVRSSYCGIYLGNEEHLQPLLHYDYERNKDLYPEAHVQVYGRHEALETLLQELGRDDRMEKLHLPVGGRRFRPALEDVIEFLVAEGLVEPKTGWEGVLATERTSFRRRQIAAVVRRNHATAITELNRLGYTVLPPTDSAIQSLVRLLLTPKASREASSDAARSQARVHMSRRKRR